VNLKDAQEKTTVLQSKLHQASKESPERRFHALYDKLYREDVLQVAWYQVRKNKGAPGIDGVSLEAVEEQGVDEYLAALGEELKSQQYRPTSVRRAEIPKSNGKTRKLGIPTVRDRIVQAAAKIVLEPIFEADFKETSFGFRPGMGQLDALAAVKRNAREGYNHVVDADIEGFFDHLDHDLLMKALRRRISDGLVLRLIYRWLKAGVGMGDEWIALEEGTPQGGVISPLLANIYLHSIDEVFPKLYLGRITRFADDLVIQCRTPVAAKRAKESLRDYLARLKLTLSATKTQIVEDAVEGFTFLGFFHRRCFALGSAGPLSYNLRWPSQSACQKFRDKFKEVLRRGVRPQGTLGWDIKRDALNDFIRGWGHYFRHGQGTAVLKKLDWYARERAARFLARCQPKGKRRKKRKWQSFLPLLKGDGKLLRLGDPRDWTQSNPHRGMANVRWRAV
jgi:group II intron reverse transcriptase/maturase